MPRVKRGVIHVKRRKNILKQTKGFRWGRKNLIRLAKQAATRAGIQALFHRRKKKSEFRSVWLIRLNAFLRGRHQISYSQFMGKLKTNKIQLNKKVLSELGQRYPQVLDKIVDQLK